MAPRTMFDKIWQDHEVGDGLLYIDLHLVHEVTSPAGVRGAAPGRPERPPARPHVATIDHNVPTDERRRRR